MTEKDGTDAATTTADEGKDVNNPGEKNDGPAANGTDDPNKAPEGGEKKEPDFKKLYYQTEGKFNAFKKEVAGEIEKLKNAHQNPEKKVDPSKFDEDTTAYIQQEAKRIAQETIEQMGLKAPAAGEDKEWDLFTSKTPEAYIHQETIQNLRKQYPTMSYSKIYRTFIEDEDSDNIPKKPLGGGNDGPSNGKPDDKKVDPVKPNGGENKGGDAAAQEAAIEASWNNMKSKR